MSSSWSTVWSVSLAENTWWNWLCQIILLNLQYITMNVPNHYHVLKKKYFINHPPKKSPYFLCFFQPNSVLKCLQPWLPRRSRRRCRPGSRWKLWALGSGASGIWTLAKWRLSGNQKCPFFAQENQHDTYRTTYIFTHKPKKKRYIIQ